MICDFIKVIQWLVTSTIGGIWLSSDHLIEVFVGF
jgi:hypothetical protein